MFHDVRLVYVIGDMHARCLIVTLPLYGCVYLCSIFGGYLERD